MSKGNVEFTCGASFETADAEHAPVGRKILVYTTPDQGQMRPKLDGQPAPCFLRCPCPGKGHRKQEECFFPDGGEGFAVTCQILRCVPILNPNS